MQPVFVNDIGNYFFSHRCTDSEILSVFVCTYLMLQVIGCKSKQCQQNIRLHCSIPHCIALYSFQIQTIVWISIISYRSNGVIFQRTTLCNIRCFFIWKHGNAHSSLQFSLQWQSLSGVSLQLIGHNSELWHAQTIILIQLILMTGLSPQSADSLPISI